MNEIEIKDLNNFCKKIRRHVVEMIYTAKSGHPGGNLSCVEIISTLYKKCMKHYPDWKKNPDFKNRDRFILSKGHASATLYSVLAECGYFPIKKLITFRKLGSNLQGHPSSMFLKGVEVSTGSLGQGLGLANGIALSLKSDKINSNVYILLGDGELQEGSVWEAAMAASHYRLNNIIAFIDKNGLQIDGPTKDIMNVNDVSAKFVAFGWNVMQIDGHNVLEIESAVNEAKKSIDKPTAIVATTIKGKGISFMENQVSWHGKAPKKEDFELAMKELN